VLHESRAVYEPADRCAIGPLQPWRGLLKYEIRVADFSRFVDAQGYETDAERNVDGVTGCWAFDLEAKQVRSMP
jgi:hypothetical protein